MTQNTLHSNALACTHTHTHTFKNHFVNGMHAHARDQKMKKEKPNKKPKHMKKANCEFNRNEAPEMIFHLISFSESAKKSEYNCRTSERVFKMFMTLSREHKKI